MKPGTSDRGEGHCIAEEEAPPPAGRQAGRGAPSRAVTLWASRGMPASCVRDELHTSPLRLLPADRASGRETLVMCSLLM